MVPYSPSSQTRLSLNHTRTPTRRPTKPLPPLATVPAPALLAARARLSAASSVSNRARSVRSVFVVVAVEPGGANGGGDLPLIFVGDGDLLQGFLVFVIVTVAEGGAGVADVPTRALGPRNPVESALVPSVPPENEDGEGV